MGTIENIFIFYEKNNVYLKKKRKELFVFGI